MSLLEEVAIRPIAQSDAAAAHQLSSHLGWPHRLDDWNMLISLGQGYVAVTPEVVGTALWWPFEPRQGSVGMIIVAPQMQGRGIGKAMMRRILADAEGRVLTLNSTAAGAKLYEGLGFVANGTVHQFQGVLNGLPGESQPHVGHSPALVSEIVRFDRNATGMDRARILHHLTEVGEVATSFAVGGELDGYGISRPFGRGTLIGPIVATSEAVALGLTKELLAAGQGFTRIDLVDPSHDFMQLVASRGLVSAGVVATMRSGIADAAAGITPKPFAVASQALG